MFTYTFRFPASVEVGIAAKSEDDAFTLACEYARIRAGYIFSREYDPSRDFHPRSLPEGTPYRFKDGEARIATGRADEIKNAVEEAVAYLKRDGVIDAERQDLIAGLQGILDCTPVCTGHSGGYRDYEDARDHDKVGKKRSTYSGSSYGGYSGGGSTNLPATKAATTTLKATVESGKIAAGWASFAKDITQAARIGAYMIAQGLGAQWSRESAHTPSAEPGRVAAVVEGADGTKQVTTISANGAQTTYYLSGKDQNRCLNCLVRLHGYEKGTVYCRVCQALSGETTTPPNSSPRDHLDCLQCHEPLGPNPPNTCYCPKCLRGGIRRSRPPKALDCLDCHKVLDAKTEPGKWFCTDCLAERARIREAREADINASIHAAHVPMVVDGCVL